MQSIPRYVHHIAIERPRGTPSPALMTWREPLDGQHLGLTQPPAAQQLLRPCDRRASRSRKVLVRSHARFSPSPKSPRGPTTESPLRPTNRPAVPRADGCMPQRRSNPVRPPPSTGSGHTRACAGHQDHPDRPVTRRDVLGRFDHIPRSVGSTPAPTLTQHCRPGAFPRPALRTLGCEPPRRSPGTLSSIQSSTRARTRRAAPTRRQTHLWKTPSNLPGSCSQGA